MHVRVLTTNQLALGVDPLNPTIVIDLSKEAIRPLHTDQISNVPKPQEPVSTRSTVHEQSQSSRAQRTTGKHFICINDKMINCRSLKELLAEGLKSLEQHRPGTLDKLSKISPRSKYIVARDPSRLFQNIESVEKFAARLTSEWWYGTNNSADETKNWLRRSAELAGLVWDRDITSSL